MSSKINPAGLPDFSMLLHFFKKARLSFLDSIFPKKCLSCNQEGEFVCHECFFKIPIAKSQKCFVCGRRLPEMEFCAACQKKNLLALRGILVASDWQNLLVRQIVYECKYRFVRELAQVISKIILNFIKKNAPSCLDAKQNHSAILIPVPLHRRRRAWRGFNQAEEIAKEISKKINFPLYKNLIFRNRHTSPQAEIADRTKRIKNIFSAFSINAKLPAENILKNKIVVLVDDISTTGATLNECALVLKKFRPKEIWGLVLARG